MGSHLISLDIGLILLVFGLSYRLTQILHILIQYQMASQYPISIVTYLFGKSLVQLESH